MKIEYMTMAQIRERHEHGIESLIGRSVGDTELINFMNDEASMNVEWSEEHDKYRVEYNHDGAK